LRGCLLRPRQRASRTELTLPASFPFSSFSSHLRTICWSPQGSAAWWHWLDSHFRQLRLQQLLPFLLLLLLLLLLRLLQLLLLPFLLLLRLLPFLLLPFLLLLLLLP